MAKSDWKVREVSIKLRDGTVKPVAELTRKQRLSLQDAAMERAGYKRVQHGTGEIRA